MGQMRNHILTWPYLLIVEPGTKKALNYFMFNYTTKYIEIYYLSSLMVELPCWMAEAQD